ncbi:MAG: thioredoxin family protein [Opitutaceae bacterium]|nr:thioredoxin family protein [Opitutaceae bacterium]
MSPHTTPPMTKTPETPTAMLPFSRWKPNRVCHLLSDKFSGLGPVNCLWVTAFVVATGFASAQGNVAPVPAAQVQVEDIWSAKVPEFRADAAREAGPVVLYFTATWCGYCRQMERTTLSNSSVRSRLAAFERIKIDYDQQPELVARYRIRGVPAFVMVNARGEEIARLVGAVEPDPFRGWLEDGKARAAELARETSRRAEEIRQLSAILEAPGGEAWEATKARIYEMAARGEPGSREFAIRQLTARIETKPSMVLDGLLHTDLAVRITVAGLLRKKWGERFVFDPWADGEDRRKAVELMATVL